MKKKVRAGGRLEVELVEDGVVVATVCRPKVRNALDLETIMAIGEVVEELEGRPEVIALVLTGNGPGVFVSGGDLEQFAGLQGEVGGSALSSMMGEIIGRMAALPQISIAAIGGDAYGGGVELALGCDLRIMGRSAWLSLTQGRFGLTTGWGGAVRLVRLIGYSRALDMMLNQRRIGAEEAAAIGLINRAVEDGQALAEARSMAHHIVSLGRDVALGIKATVWAAAFDSPADAILKERQIFATLWGSERHVATVASFLSRKGRNTGPET